MLLVNLAKACPCREYKQHWVGMLQPIRVPTVDTLSEWQPHSIWSDWLVCSHLLMLSTFATRTFSKTLFLVKAGYSSRTALATSNGFHAENRLQGGRKLDYPKRRFSLVAGGTQKLFTVKCRITRPQ